MSEGHHSNSVLPRCEVAQSERVHSTEDFDDLLSSLDNELLNEQRSDFAQVPSASNSVPSGSKSSTESLVADEISPKAMTTVNGATVPYAGNQKGNFNGPMLNLNIPRMLPHEQVFSIQVGDTLFRLSGASLSSDGPSYFTSFFKAHMKAKECPVLYIDRSPEVFRDIVRHLQGYYVVPRDDNHYVYLYADAHYYQLPKLVKLLFNSEIIVRIGSTPFRVPRELLSKPGDSPNYFTLGFSSFFSSPEEVFPGTKGLMRPPSVAPPSVPAHSDTLFAQLLQVLKGGHIDIKSEEHRDALIRECRYYHFRGLEQKLIPYNISKNLLTGREEITIRLKDMRPAQVTVEDSESDRKRLEYKRPFTDNEARELIVQIDANEFVLRSYDITTGDNGRTTCRWGAQVTEGSVMSEKLRALMDKLPGVKTPEPDTPIRLGIDIGDAAVTLNGEDVIVNVFDDGTTEFGMAESRKRRRTEDQPERGIVMPRNMAVNKAQLKMGLVKNVLVLHVASIELVSTMVEVNRKRKYI